MDCREILGVVRLWNNTEETMKFWKRSGFTAPCGGLRGGKNRPAPFPDRMSYKETKPGSVLPLSLFFECVCCAVN